MKNHLNFKWNEALCHIEIVNNKFKRFLFAFITSPFTFSKNCHCKCFQIIFLYESLLPVILVLIRINPKNNMTAAAKSSSSI